MKVLPFIVGARGSCPTLNDPVFATFHLPRGLRVTIATSALQWGVSIHRVFMSTVWRLPKNQASTGNRKKVKKRSNNTVENQRINDTSRKKNDHITPCVAE